MKNQPISEQSEKKVNKSVQKELLSEMMRKDEEDGIYIRTVTHCPTCGAECTVEVEGETHYYRPKEGKLREAAEKVVELETLCAEAMGEMPKEWRDRFRNALNSKKNY